MKMRKLTALLASACMVLTAMPAQAAEDPLFGTLPDWVPTNFVDALTFYNSHGKSYCADGIICLVRPMKKHDKENYRYSASGSMLYVNTPYGSEPQYYELEIPEKPDENDEQAWEELRAYCRKLNVYDGDYSFFESYQEDDMFEVTLLQVLDGRDLTLSWEYRHDDGYIVTNTFSFEDRDGTIVETDKYGWLPDSEPEFKVFLDQNGRASIHENYIVYCDDTNFSTGTSMTMEQSGEGKIRQAFESNCASFDLMPVEGGAYSSVILYEPTADGIVDVTWTVGRDWASEPPVEVTERKYQISDNCTSVTEASVLVKNCTVFKFVDQNTGELIDVSDMLEAYLMKSTGGEASLNEYFVITTDPLTVEGLNAYSEDCYYSIGLGSEYGRYNAPSFEITAQTADSMEVTCKLKWNPSGDVNGDNAFNIADAVIMQKCLFGDHEDKSMNWRALDFYHDGQLDARDLTLMKQQLILAKEKPYVEPDNRIEWGSRMYVLTDGLKLHQGPDESYPVITQIPEGSQLTEYGFQNDNNSWLFTEFQGQYGWVRFRNEDGSYNIFWSEVADKPVIYLYPEQETDVHVELELTESELSTTYPKYQDGWDVTAYPDGKLLNKADGTHHRYLFWDSVNCRTRYDFSKGFCVAGSETEAFLKESLTNMGLTEEEMNEFIVYWLPRMEHNAYNLIAFQTDAYTESAKLHITPEPDSIFRVFMAYVPLKEAVEIEPQQLSTFERTGFSVLEWGGSEIKS